MNGAKTDQLAFHGFFLCLVGRILLGFLTFCLWLRCGLSSLEADERRENLNALFAPLDPAAQFVPRAHACYVCSRWLLPRNEKDVAKAVSVKLRHCVEILRE